jgi:putative tryptophan/tyrosine transport system substrate-binding protein
MRRREFITALGSTAIAWPIAARAQQGAMPVIGLLTPVSANAFSDQVEAFRRGLAEIGYIEGRNVTMEYRWADGEYNRLPALAADLVRSRVAVIAALGSSAPGRAAKAATSTTPIVFQAGGDPVEEGLVASMNQPGGNITGVSRMNVATDPKRLELLHEAVPKASVIACLVNPTSPRFGLQIQQVQASARSLGLNLHVVNASTERDLEDAFAMMVKGGVAALLLATDPSMTAMQEQIARLATTHALPTMAGTRSIAAAGVLMSYDASLTDSFRQAGVYVGRILKGDKPADLPIMQPTKFELVINLKTAKALGLDLPPKLLALADEVIE